MEPLCTARSEGAGCDTGAPHTDSTSFTSSESAKSVRWLTWSEITALAKATMNRLPNRWGEESQRAARRIRPGGRVDGGESGVSVVIRRGSDRPVRPPCVRYGMKAQNSCRKRAGAGGGSGNLRRHGGVEWNAGRGRHRRHPREVSPRPAVARDAGG